MTRRTALFPNGAMDSPTRMNAPASRRVLRVSAFNQPRSPRQSQHEEPVDALAQPPRRHVRTHPRVRAGVADGDQSDRIRRLGQPRVGPHRQAALGAADPPRMHIDEADHLDALAAQCIVQRAPAGPGAADPHRASAEAPARQVRYLLAQETLGGVARIAARQPPGVVAPVQQRGLRLAEAATRLRRAQLGFVFQSFHLIPRLSAQENIELPMLLEGIAPVERHRRAREVMERLGLLERAGHKPGQLSGGQQQRVAIARAIVMRPSLLLTDEPTGNLDSKSGRDVLELLEELHHSGITLLMVTHDAQLGSRAHRHIRMVDGKIVEDSSRAPA